MAHDHDSQTRPTFEYRTCDQCQGCRAVPVLAEERMQPCPKCQAKGVVRVELPEPEPECRYCGLPDGHVGECDLPF